jgi:hypothetical protein
LYGIDVTVFRYFTVYGPAGRPDMVMFRFTKWIHEGMPLMLNGDGEQSRGFTYVDDIARGTILGLKPVGYEVINLGGHESIKINELIHILEGMIGKSATIEYLPFHPADMLANWANVEKAKRLLGWEPKVTLQEGIAKLVAWYDNELEWASQVNDIAKETALQTLRSWWQDKLLRGIVKNSGYLFSSNSAAMVLSIFQGILAARLLGIERFGILSATVIPFVSNVHRFLSFRMSELVVKYMGQFLVQGKNDRAAAIVKGAALVEAATAVVGYLVLLGLTPLAAQYLAKDPATQPLFILYGLILLSNAFFETSTGILQVNRLFKKIALVNFFQSLITAGLILFAFLSQGGMMAVLVAYLVGKTFSRVGALHPGCPPGGPAAWNAAGGGLL